MQRMGADGRWVGGAVLIIIGLALLAGEAVPDIGHYAAFHYDMLPDLPKIKRGYAYIQSAWDGPIEWVEDFFPVEQWAESYAYNKWRIFVYAPREFQAAVRDASIEVITKRLELEIDREKSNRSCHL